MSKRLIFLDIFLFCLNPLNVVTPIDEEEEDIATDGPSSLFNNETVPPKADLFTFWATVPGFGAIRDRKKGTWFIQTLCKKMEELGDRYRVCFVFEKIIYVILF